MRRTQTGIIKEFIKDLPAIKLYDQCHCYNNSEYTPQQQPEGLLPWKNSASHSFLTPYRLMIFISIFIIVIFPLAKTEDCLEERRHFKAAFHTQFFLSRYFSNVFVRAPPLPDTHPTAPHPHQFNYPTFVSVFLSCVCLSWCHA